MMRTFLLLFTVLSAVHARTQDVAGFVDYMDRLYVFDKGVFRQVEPRKPISIHKGGNYIAYADNRDDLKVYRDGESRIVDRAGELDVIVTDHFLGFTVAGILKVFDGRTRMLCPNVGKYIVEDSLVAFEDIVNQKVQVFYNEETIKLEDQLAGNAVLAWQSGDNVLAWISSYDRLLKVFYHGRIYELSDLVREVDMKCGLDMVAYRDPYDHTFKVFHQGTIYDLEERMPHRYEVGKGVLAWLDLTGSLKVFEGGRVHTAMTFEPQAWHMVDSLLVIEDQSFFNVFSNGKLHTVERVVPQKWQASWGTLAYVDVDRTLKVWRNGVAEVVVRGQPVQEFVVERGLVLARLNIGTARVWWRGRTYDH
ncbi:MAG: hypothetical protein KF905_10790 [Flavobacteriales bacterium]|nr:hypothetical protein [Flavobacteriales bacterium]